MPQRFVARLGVIASTSLHSLESGKSHENGPRLPQDLQSKDKVQVDARLLMYAAGLDDGAAYVSPNATTSSPAADDVSAGLS